MKRLHLLLSLMIVFFLVMVIFISIACKGPGDDDSEKVSAPVFDPDGGEGDYFDVTITTETDGAQIRYTTDGSTPGPGSGEIYSGPIPVYKTMTIKAIAFKTGYNDSNVSESNLFSLNPVTKTIVSDGDVGWYTSLAVDRNTLYVCYDDATNHDLMMAKSMDGGVTWDMKVIDGTIEMGHGYTSAAVDGSNIYISYNINNLNDLLFAQSMDSGNTWSLMTIDPVDVRWDTSLGMVGNNIFIVYGIDPGVDLKFARSTDYGETWDTQTIDSNAGYTQSLAMEGNDIYISYNYALEDELRLATSSNQGDSWNLYVVDSDVIIDDSTSTSIGVNGSTIYIGYIAHNEWVDDDLKLATSLDSGLTWSIQTIVSDGDENHSWTHIFLSVAVEGSNIYLSYRAVTDYDLKLAKSTDGGDTWSIKTVDSTGNVGDYNSIAVDGSNIYISYYDETNTALKFAKSADGGDTWE
ncbi:MAG: chitobiase/beta-hexosaminidase C-terminal domain-containing protein [Spirochaetales bacterium]|nr:chitobiase/beta-hexosaminidase C-terminal domain-containing protein [Spirochaetales bacterium]